MASAAAHALLALQHAQQALQPSADISGAWHSVRARAQQAAAACQQLLVSEGSNLGLSKTHLQPAAADLLELAKLCGLQGGSVQLSLEPAYTAGSSIQYTLRTRTSRMRHQSPIYHQELRLHALR